MTNETKIKVPKKYQHMVESIQLIDSWKGKYLLTLTPSAGVRNPYYSDSQADVLEMIRLSYAAMQESAPAPASEEIEAPESEIEVPDTFEECLALLDDNKRLSSCFCLYCDLVDAVALEFDGDATAGQIITRLGDRFSAWGLEDMDEDEWEMLYRQAARVRLSRSTEEEDTADVEETASGQDALPGTDATTVLENKSHIDALEVLENDGSAVSNEQGSVPTEMAVDASAASPDQETTAAVVDDRRVVYIVCNGYLDDHLCVDIYSSMLCDLTLSGGCHLFDDHASAWKCAMTLLENFPDACFHDYSDRTSLQTAPPE